MVKRLLQINHEFWNHERSLKALLIYLSLSLFVWMPMPAYRWWGFIISDFLFYLIILSGVFAVLTRWRRQLIFITIALLTCSIRVISFFSDNQGLLLASYVVSIMFFVLLGRMVVFHIFKDGPVNFYRIQGSIIVFIIVGIVYAFLYTLIEALIPASFASTDLTRPLQTSFSQFLYFSFVTMTTLGYGDMIPIGPIAKSFVIAQGMIGLLYPVIMIARLVSMEVAHSAAHKSNLPKV